jgi:hypothetical protein
MKNNKNFYILLGNLSVLSYLLVGLPKVFSILTEKFSANLLITIQEFNILIYKATFFSLAGKIIFSFLINNKKFDEYIAINYLYITMIIIHSCSMIFCLSSNLSINIYSRYIQGFTAGVINILLEPIIFNYSQKQWRKDLLYWKYELIALLTPVCIFLTNLTESNYQLIIIIFSIIPIIIGLTIFMCQSGDENYFQEQNNLLSLKGFFMALKNKSIIINNIIIGLILGIFLILIQNHYYLYFKTFSSWSKGLIQGLPFTLSFLIARNKYRNFFNYLSIIIMNISIIGCIFTLGNNNLFLWFIGIFINSLYIIYVLWTPYLLNNLLNDYTNISNRSVSTASQVIRSLVTYLIGNYLSQLYKKNFFSNNNNFLIFLLLLMMFCFFMSIKFLLNIKKNHHKK